VPIRLSGPWLTIAWAVEAAVLMWIGVGARIALLRGAAFILLAAVTQRLLTVPILTHAVVFNPRFAAFATAVAAIAVALVPWRRSPDSVDVRERPLFAVLAVVINVLALVALSLEVHDALAAPVGVARAAMTPYRFAQQLGLSLLWTTYAAGLMAAGVRRALAGLRWQALVLLSATVLKVLLFDLSFLQGGYRVVSSIALGIVLLLVSLRYQRRGAAARKPEAP
jgi:uncharacterized membrane protein